MTGIRTPSHELVAILQWAAGLGAVTADALAQRQQISLPAARSRLGAAHGQQLLRRARPLAGRPALYTLTRVGLRAAGAQGIEPCRVTAANAAHLIECARVAAALERSYPRLRVQGERELRRAERELGAPIASAPLGRGPDGAPLLHRPDLVLWPAQTRRELPVAIEVELTVKAPRRLRAICLAWGRCRAVAGVLYVISSEVDGPLLRARAGAGAGERIVVLPLAALPDAGT